MHFPFIFIFALTLILLSFLGSGLIGPAWSKKALRRLYRWYFRDTGVLGSIDPYKPLGSAIEQSGKNFWPSRKRLAAANAQIRLGMLFLSLIGLAAVVAAIWLNGR